MPTLPPVIHVDQLFHLFWLYAGELLGFAALRSPHALAPDAQKRIWTCMFTFRGGALEVAAVPGNTVPKRVPSFGLVSKVE